MRHPTLVHMFLQQIIDYPISDTNTEAVRLKALAAKALLAFKAPREPLPAKVPSAPRKKTERPKPRVHISQTMTETGGPVLCGSPTRRDGFSASLEQWRKCEGRQCQRCATALAKLTIRSERMSNSTIKIQINPISQRLLKIMLNGEGSNET